MKRSKADAAKPESGKNKLKVELSDEQFLAISRAVSDPRRFAILQQVAQADEPSLPCGALHEHAVLSPATISHHVKELVDAGLVGADREGRCMNLSLQRPVWKAYLKRLGKL